MTVMVKVEVKEKRRGRKEDMEHSSGEYGRGQWMNVSWANNTHAFLKFLNFWSLQH
jgi:hypothetical protein